MRINDLDLYLVEVARHAPQAKVRSLLVRLITESGREGWGEAQCYWRTSELELRRERLLALLAGRNVFDVEELRESLAREPLELRSSVEMACWDLVARSSLRPLAQIMGGEFRQRIPLCVRLPPAEPEPTAALARETADLGFRTLLLSATGQIELDRQMLRLVAEAVADRAELRFDGRRLFNLDEAVEVVQGLGDRPLQFLLDPLRSADLQLWAALRRRVGVPLGASTTLHKPGDVLAAWRSGAVEFIAINMQQVGGLVAARQCATIALAGGMGASLACPPGLGVAVAAQLQLAAATPALSGGNECSYHELRDDVIADSLTVVDGMLPLPQAPGLGVEVDRARLDRHLLS